MSHPGIEDEDIPYYYQRSVLGQVWHLIRKGICQNIAPNCVLTPVRIGLYRLCGFKIGKGVFIGMKCYFDDVCPENMIIEDHVGISYGVYFSCHGRKQSHNKIVLRKDWWRYLIPAGVLILVVFYIYINDYLDEL